MLLPHIRLGLQSKLFSHSFGERGKQKLWSSYEKVNSILNGQVSKIAVWPKVRLALSEFLI